MMALAKLLHHPQVRADLIKDTETKRSNKDLCRVVALAWLTAERDRRNGTKELEAWPNLMAVALRQSFPDRARQLAHLPAPASAN